MPHGLTNSAGETVRPGADDFFREYGAEYVANDVVDRDRFDRCCASPQDCSRTEFLPGIASEGEAVGVKF